jgi:hypothetical protein
MDNWQVLIAVNTVLLMVVSFFIRQWITGLKDDIKALEDGIIKIQRDLEKKAGLVDCVHTHEALDRLLHRHATTGTAGEAVYK